MFLWPSLHPLPLFQALLLASSVLCRVYFMGLWRLECSGSWNSVQSIKQMPPPFPITSPLQSIRSHLEPVLVVYGLILYLRGFKAVFAMSPVFCLLCRSPWSLSLCVQWILRASAEFGISCVVSYARYHGRAFFNAGLGVHVHQRHRP